jgi:adenylate cyclase
MDSVFRRRLSPFACSRVFETPRSGTDCGMEGRNPQRDLHAIRLDPAIKHLYVHFLGSAYLVAGDYKAAASLFSKRILLSPKTDLSRAFLAVALGHLGEAGEARRVWRELMEINPKYSFAEHVARLPFRNQADVDRLAEGLRQAGIPA